MNLGRAEPRTKVFEKSQKYSYFNFFLKKTRSKRKILDVIVQISISRTPNRGVTVREMDSNARKVQIRIFFVSIVSRKTPKPCIFQFAKPQISCFF